MTTMGPHLCMSCLHLRGDGTCDAFTAGIPQAILDGGDHTRAWPGDGGVHYQTRPGQEYLLQLWREYGQPAG